MAGGTRLTTTARPDGVPVSARSPRHHGTHRALLRTEPAASVPPGDVDAIVVPTVRPTPYLRTAVNVAADLGCTLVVLCSRHASVTGATELAVSRGVEVVAVDLERPPDLLPSFTTTELLDQPPFRRRSDLSLKRNLALLLAQLVGWRRVVFLDDDITVPDPADLRRAAGLLDTCAAAGLAVDGFPDNSVVCHANRAVGRHQETFVGGGALAVNTAALADSFFPRIYNEDWFFLLDDEGLRPTAVTGTVVQQPYDPFADETRARSEELGDCLAEGVFGLLDQGMRVRDATTDYWAAFLADRHQLITDLLALVADLDREPAERERMAAALRAARGRSQLIDPELCVDYLAAWRTDRQLWRRHVHDLCGDTRRRPPNLPAALARLGLERRSRYESARPAGQAAAVQAAAVQAGVGASVLTRM